MHQILKENVLYTHSACVPVVRRYDLWCQSFLVARSNHTPRDHEQAGSGVSLGSRLKVAHHNAVIGHHLDAARVPLFMPNTVVKQPPGAKFKASTFTCTCTRLKATCTCIHMSTCTLERVHIMYMYMYMYVHM